MNIKLSSILLLIVLAESDLCFSNNSSGVFQGNYKVGNTSCTVTPVKMAYDVKWKRGKGSIKFFFSEIDSEQKSVFISRDTGKGSDKFVFDNANYVKGKFIRADGKIFDVESLRRTD